MHFLYAFFIAVVGFLVGFTQGRAMSAHDIRRVLAAWRESYAPTIHENTLSTERLLEIASRAPNALVINGYEGALLAIELLKLRECFGEISRDENKETA